LASFYSVEARIKKVTLQGLAFTLLAVVGFSRYFRNASFWLDEAYIATNIKNHPVTDYFGPLDYTPTFPRIYLLLIKLCHFIGGYSTLVLRFFPFLFWLLASYLWLDFFRKKSKTTWGFLFGAAMLFSSSEWLRQSANLKQYSLDVLLSLCVFIFLNRKTIASRLMLVASTLVSYTYPIPLFAAFVAKEKVFRGARFTRSFLLRCLGLLLVIAILRLVLYQIDMKFMSHSTLVNYWSASILGAHLHSPFTAGRILFEFLFGWYRFSLPIFFQVLVFLFLIIEAIKIVLDQKRAPVEAAACLWILFGCIVSSLFLNLPIAPDRIVLFSLPFIQLLSLRGFERFLAWSSARSCVIVRSLAACLCLVFLFYGAKNANGARRELIWQDLRPVRKTLLNDCSTLIVLESAVIQVKTLPEGLGDKKIVYRESDEWEPAPALNPQNLCLLFITGTAPWPASFFEGLKKAGYQALPLSLYPSVFLYRLAKSS